MSTVAVTGWVRGNSVGGNKGNNSRRSLYVYLTEKGRANAARIEEAFAALESAAFEGIPETEREAFMAVFCRIYENLNGK